MGFIRKRLKEPSTWAAIACFIQLAVKYAPPEYHAVADCAVGLIAAVAGVTPEGVK